MKILFVSSLYPPFARGGGELSTHYLARALVERGHEVVVLCQSPSSHQHDTADVFEGVHVRRLNLPLGAKPLLEQRHARKLARHIAPMVTNEKFDIVHAHDFRAAQVLSEITVPGRIVTVRDYAQICGSPNNLRADGATCRGCTSLAEVWQNQAVVEASWWRKPFRMWQYRYNIAYRLSSFRVFKQHVYISQAQQVEVARIQDLTGIATHVIYNPLPPEFIAQPVKQSVNETILYVGRLQKYKGVDLLLEAFRQISAEQPNVHLRLVGEGEHKAQYERDVARWGLQYRVTFTGHLPFDRLRQLYDESSIVVAPHVWVEPFGRTVVEAMARESLVIAANVGGPAEIIQDGKTGLLFERGSVDSLVTSLQQVLHMKRLDRREIERKARQWTIAELAPVKIAEQYEKVYEQVKSIQTS